MATKRQIVSQLTPEDLEALADAAEKGSKGLEPKVQKRAKRAVKILRTLTPSAAATKEG